MTQNDEETYLPVLPGQLTRSEAESMRTTESGSKGPSQGIHEPSSPREEQAQKSNGDTQGEETEILQQTLEDPDVPLLEQFVGKQCAAVGGAWNNNGWMKEKVEDSREESRQPQQYQKESGLEINEDQSRVLNAFAERSDKRRLSGEDSSIWHRMTSAASVVSQTFWAMLKVGQMVPQSVSNIIGKSVTTFTPKKAILINEQKRAAREKLRRNPRG